MARVHFGRLAAPGGFARIVAVKRLHAEFVSDPDYVSIMLDEARLASRIHHPNVIPILDVVVEEDGEVALVMEYVTGDSLYTLCKSMNGRAIPWRIATAIMAGALYGLHAAHEARDTKGHPLGIVHRDVSPQNILVGTDGVSRVLDFGIAKALGRLQTTSVGQVKGKLAYMAPEQLLWGEVSPRTDVYAAAVVLWETLMGRRLFDAQHSEDVAAGLLGGAIPRPRTVMPDLPAELDTIVMQGLERDASARFASARDFAVALEDSVGVASARQVGEWVTQSATPTLTARAMLVRKLEQQSGTAWTLAREVPVEAAEHQPASPDASEEETVLAAPHGNARSSRDSRTPTTRPERRALSAAIAAPILIGLGLAITFLNTKRGEDHTHGIVMSSIAPPTLTQAEALVDLPARVETERHVDEPSAIPSPPPAPPERAADSAPSARSPTKAPAASKSANCRTHYTVDKEGIKRLKPECL
jgi:serine/threonine-protein kinase